MPASLPRTTLALHPLVVVVACALLLGCTAPLKTTGTQQATPGPDTGTEASGNSADTGAVLPEIKF